MTQTKELSFQDKILEGMDSRKILLVDDEPDTLMLTSFTLTRAGFNIVLAENGQQAIEKYGQEKPVMVILDRMMPEMDGIEVCRQLRTLDPDLYIMILTALDTDSDRITGWEAGADDYVGKPINFKELVLRVKARMRRITGEVTLPAEPVQKPSTSTTPAKIESTTTARRSITEPTQSELEKVDLEKAAATDNRQVQSYLLRASRAAQAYEIDRAHELYLQALEIEPINPVALKWLAYHTSNPHEGCEYLEKLVIVQPDNVKARRLLEIGRQRCRELDQQAFSNILSYMNPVAVPEPVAAAAPATKYKTVSAPPKPAAPPKRQIGELLIEKGYITRENIETAANLQQMFQQAGAPKKLGEILVEYGVLTEEQLKRVLAEQNAAA